MEILIDDWEIAWAREALAKASRQFPDFDSNGAHPFRSSPAKPFQNHQLWMVVVCREWILLRGTRKTIHKRRTSYGYKHTVERWINGYVTNSAFIAAAAGLDIAQTPCDHLSPNTFLGISCSKRELPALQRIECVATCPQQLITNLAS